MDDFDIATSKIGESAQRVIDRAIDETRRRDNFELTTGHIFLAFIQTEWHIFSDIMRDFHVNPHKILEDIGERLGSLPKGSSRGLRISTQTKLLFKLAYHGASRSGRQVIESSDLFVSLFEEKDGVSSLIMRRHGIKVEELINQINEKLRSNELREERLRKRFELPPFLKHFATNLNLLARQDKIPPVYGRDSEIRKVLEILCHRERSNSVMLIGEPGVGKTAIVEGLARIIEYEPEKIPPRLRECQIANLQMNSMVAGTMLRGMFEDRMQNVIREIKERPNLILFIDEAHTMIGAGSALGAPSDAANVFKSVLARGDVRIIGSTTLGEYKEFIEQDEALARRFRTVHISEPTIEETREILYKIKPRLERSYSVKILDEAIETALVMSPRYQRHLKLPDKPIGWLDTAAVRAEIDKRWEVNENDVIDVISNVSDIPKDMVFRDVGDRFKDINGRLANRVIGQKKAINAVADRLVLSKGFLKDGFDRPDGVLLFLGPTGVGKTELAKAVAEFLFGNEKKMIRIDLSEYQGEGSVDKLIGMPRGIVGSQQGGILTNQLKDMPCTVLLLDEVEKANPHLLNLFLQAFDEGWITDGRGRRVYLSDAIIIMTSNLGSEHFRKLHNPLGFRYGEVQIKDIKKDVNRELERKFTPEFRNRIDQVVIFEPLTKDEVRQIALNYIDKIKRTMESEGKALDVEKDALDKLAIEGYNSANGARFLKKVIDTRVKTPISHHWKESNSFHVRLINDEIIVEPNGAIGEFVGTDVVKV